MSLISKIKDQNIFHIFAFDIITHHDSRYKKAIIDSSDLDLDNPCQKWRRFVMEKLYGEVEYSENCIGESKLTHNGFEYFEFKNYKPDIHIWQIYDIISSKKNGEYVLLNQRNFDDRYLYDYNTKEKLEDYLRKQDLKFPLKTCNFDDMTPEEQYEVCAKCALLVSVHGAGCTNLIFTPQSTHLLEINFRKHWYCDAVCDDHFNGAISVNEKCNGTLNYHPYYHKADYHNLCHLLNKRYSELEAIEYSEGFNSRNPISKKKIYIDGGNVVEYINNLDVDTPWTAPFLSWLRGAMAARERF